MSDPIRYWLNSVLGLVVFMGLLWFIFIELPESPKDDDES